MNFLEGPELKFEDIQRGDKIATIVETDTDEFEIEVFIVDKFNKSIQEWRSVSGTYFINKRLQDDTTIILLERDENRFPPKGIGNMIFIKRAYEGSGEYSGSLFAVKMDDDDGRWFSPMYMPLQGHWHHDNDIQEWEFAVALPTSDFDKIMPESRIVKITPINE